MLVLLKLSSETIENININELIKECLKILINQNTKLNYKKRT